MGKNHTFGKDRKGTYDFLHNWDDKNHINVFVLNLHTEDTIVASSTKIRNLISESRIDDAVGMLGHPYPILVKRIRGMRKGFKLGYPTLNFKCPSSLKVIPPPGIYAAEVEYKDLLLKGALYFGNCPTFENRDYHFEFHALGPVTCDPGVNAEVALWLYSFIRPEKRFNSEDLLIEQIKKDIFLIKQIFLKE
jgi:riboflavin kinase/FMN adenylyltransferase